MAIIDWEQFNENYQYYDEEIIREIIEDFLAESDDRLMNIQKNIADNDFVNLTFNAHSIKSVVGVFMAQRPLELALRLEMMGKQQLNEGLVEAFSELKISINELVAELREYLNK